MQELRDASLARQVRNPKQSPPASMVRSATSTELFPKGLSPWRPPRIISMPSGEVCALCGSRIARFGMLRHMYEAHGERPVVKSPAIPRKDRN